MNRRWIFGLGLALCWDAQAGSIRGTLRGGAPGVVYIEHASSGPRPGGEAPQLSQKNLHFSPQVLVVQVGQPVEVPNLDKTYHNVFSVAPGNEFDLGLYRQGQSRTLTFQRAGEVDVYCNIHPTMAAKVLVLQNGHYALVGDDGGYAIADVPDGSYVLWAWSPTHKPERRAISLRGAAPLTIDFTLRPRKQEAAHLNKYGEQYGRYK